MADGSEDFPANGALVPLKSVVAASPPEITAIARMLGDEVAAARSYRAQAKAANTIRAYCRLPKFMETAFMH